MRNKEKPQVEPIRSPVKFCKIFELCRIAKKGKLSIG